MNNFAYTARDAQGQPCSGNVVAETPAEALKVLRADGKFPVSIRPAEQAAKGGAVSVMAARAGIHISRADVMQFSQQLVVMVETGVVLSDALECIAKQAEKPQVAALVRDLSEQLQGGSSLSDALARHPRSFPTLYVALVRASEKSGMLAQLLSRATTYLRDEQDTRRRVQGALTYPAIMFTFAITTTIFLLTFVMPRFTVIYANKKAALPAPTQVLMNLSDFLVTNWIALLVGVVSAAVGIFFYVRTGPGARVWHYIQLRAPLLGKLYRKMHLARGLRMVGTMSGAGVTLMDCVTTAHDLCENSYFQDLWQQVSESIQVGKQLSEPLFASPLVPRSVSQMISSGEKSGRLSHVMEQIAGYAEQELKEQILALTRYIEPMMIIGMGFIIGGVALALLLPIFTISNVMAH